MRNRTDGIIFSLFHLLRYLLKFFIEYCFVNINGHLEIIIIGRVRLVITRYIINERCGTPLLNVIVTTVVTRLFTIRSTGTRATTTKDYRAIIRDTKTTIFAAIGSTSLLTLI